MKNQIWLVAIINVLLNKYLDTMCNTGAHIHTLLLDTSSSLTNNYLNIFLYYLKLIKKDNSVRVGVVVGNSDVCGMQCCF